MDVVTNRFDLRCVKAAAAGVTCINPHWWDSDRRKQLSNFTLWV